jgi:hypothetical protein
VCLSGRESPVVPLDDPYHDTMALGGRGVHDLHQGGCHGRCRAGMGQHRKVEIGRG